MLYNECVKCSKLGVECDGPNFFTLPAHDILEWCKARKAELHLSNDKLADLSGIPRGTVARIFAGSHEDFKFGTVQPILRVLIGGTYHRESCPDPNGDSAAKIQALEKNNESLRSVIKENKAAYDADLERERADADRREDYLKSHLKEKTKIIKVLSISLSCAVTIILAALIIDFLRPNIGFIWSQAMNTILGI